MNVAGLADHCCESLSKLTALSDFARRAAMLLGMHPPVTLASARKSSDVNMGVQLQRRPYSCWQKTSCKRCTFALRAAAVGAEDSAKPRFHLATHDNVDIDSVYKLADSDLQRYRDNGFIKLRNVFTDSTLQHFAPDMSLEVKAADKTSLQQDPDYQQAFTQVLNMRKKSKQVSEFVMGHRLARIAAELMGVEGVRVYADQALYKEPHGGYTPWHCDAFYWPLATDKAITAWVPLQATPQEMGPMQFAVGSHKVDLGRHLDISRESHKLIDAKVQQGGFEVVKEAFDLGEVSFHSSFNFHKTNGNQTDKPREVFTIIFMDQNMTLAEPKNEYQHRDRNAYFPDLFPGQLCDSESNPVVWSHESSA